MSRERVDAIVTFVQFGRGRGREVLAFFRATKKPSETAWHKVEPRPSWAHEHCAAWLTECYAHIGQHGEADLRILRNGRRATPYEYGPLLKEMRDIVGYNVTAHQKGRLRLKGVRV